MDKRYLIIGGILIGAILLFSFMSSNSPRGSESSLGTEVLFLKNKGYNVHSSSWSTYYDFVKTTSYTVKVVTVSQVSLENYLKNDALKNFYYDNTSIWMPSNDGTTLTVYRWIE
jgi:hypothetical protein